MAAIALKVTIFANRKKAHIPKKLNKNTQRSSKLSNFAPLPFASFIALNQKEQDRAKERERERENGSQ